MLLKQRLATSQINSLSFFIHLTKAWRNVILDWARRRRYSRSCSICSFVLISALRRCSAKLPAAKAFLANRDRLDLVQPKRDIRTGGSGNSAAKAKDLAVFPGSGHSRLRDLSCRCCASLKRQRSAEKQTLQTQTPSVAYADGVALH